MIYQMKKLHHTQKGSNCFHKIFEKHTSKPFDSVKMKSQHNCGSHSCHGCVSTEKHVPIPNASVAPMLNLCLQIRHCSPSNSFCTSLNFAPPNLTWLHPTHVEAQTNIWEIRFKSIWLLKYSPGPSDKDAAI